MEARAAVARWTPFGQSPALEFQGSAAAVADVVVAAAASLPEDLTQLQLAASPCFANRELLPSEFSAANGHTTVSLVCLGGIRFRVWKDRFVRREKTELDGDEAINTCTTLTERQLARPGSTPGLGMRHGCGPQSTDLVDPRSSNCGARRTSTHSPARLGGGGGGKRGKRRVR